MTVSLDASTVTEAFCVRPAAATETEPSRRSTAFKRISRVGCLTEMSMPVVPANRLCSRSTVNERS